MIYSETIEFQEYDCEKGRIEQSAFVKETGEDANNYYRVITKKILSKVVTVEFEYLGGILTAQAYEKESKDESTLQITLERNGETSILYDDTAGYWYEDVEVVNKYLRETFSEQTIRNNFKEALKLHVQDKIGDFLMGVDIKYEVIV